MLPRRYILRRPVDPELRGLVGGYRQDARFIQRRKRVGRHILSRRRHRDDAPERHRIPRRRILASVPAVQRNADIERPARHVGNRHDGRFVRPLLSRHPQFARKRLGRRGASRIERRPRMFYLPRKQVHWIAGAFANVHRPLPTRQQPLQAKDVISDFFREAFPIFVRRVHPRQQPSPSVLRRTG